MIQKGLLRPLTVSRPPNLSLPGYDPNSYCHFHQVTGHPTDSYMHLKYEIQNLIDSRNITDPEKSNLNPNTKTNPFSNYRNVPPLATMMINLEVSKEEVINSFKDLNLQNAKESPDAPKDTKKGVEDLLGQPSRKFDYKVFYTKLPSFDIPIELIMP